ncbi:hypothetical protein B0H66DRAFT_606339 [Apodospora peruviana]|uniref:Uncharacterized protein n=1 Tax=Apodospora peruviana TaxID=516989 RepID=A0AAE0M2D8_9PEZI|nr:hypothetical protein B0H66DRAFT_606339 [Apodospora peruviana]
MGEPEHKKFFLTLHSPPSNSHSATYTPPRSSIRMLPSYGHASQLGAADTDTPLPPRPAPKKNAKMRVLTRVIWGITNTLLIISLIYFCLSILSPETKAKGDEDHGVYNMSSSPKTPQPILSWEDGTDNNPHDTVTFSWEDGTDEAGRVTETSDGQTTDPFDPPDLELAGFDPDTATGMSMTKRKRSDPLVGGHVVTTITSTHNPQHGHLATTITTTVPTNDFSWPAGYVHQTLVSRGNMRWYSSLSTVSTIYPEEPVTTSTSTVTDTTPTSTSKKWTWTLTTTGGTSTDPTASTSLPKNATSTTAQAITTSTRPTVNTSPTTSTSTDVSNVSVTVITSATTIREEVNHGSWSTPKPTWVTLTTTRVREWTSVFTTTISESSEDEPSTVTVPVVTETSTIISESSEDEPSTVTVPVVTETSTISTAPSSTSTISTTKTVSSISTALITSTTTLSSASSSRPSWATSFPPDFTISSRTTSSSFEPSTYIFDNTTYIYRGPSTTTTTTTTSTNSTTSSSQPSQSAGTTVSTTTSSKASATGSVVPNILYITENGTTMTLFGNEPTITHEKKPAITQASQPQATPATTNTLVITEGGTTTTLWAVDSAPPPTKAAVARG